jgi:hypothetical protein
VTGRVLIGRARFRRGSIESVNEAPRRSPPRRVRWLIVVAAFWRVVRGASRIQAIRDGYDSGALLAIARLEERSLCTKA